MKKLTLLEVYRLKNLSLNVPQLPFPKDKTGPEKTIKEANELIQRLSNIDTEKIEAVCNDLKDYFNPNNNSYIRYRNFFYSIGGIDNLISCIKVFAVKVTEVKTLEKALIPRKLKPLLELLEVLLNDDSKVPNHVPYDDDFIVVLFDLLKELELFNYVQKVIESILIARKYPFDISKVKNFYKYLGLINIER